MRTDGKTNKDVYDIVTIRLPKGSVTDKLKWMAACERTKTGNKITVNDLGGRAIKAFIAGWDRDNGLTSTKVKLRTHA